MFQVPTVCKLHDSLLLQSSRSICGLQITITLILSHYRILTQPSVFTLKYRSTPQTWRRRASFLRSVYFTSCVTYHVGLAQYPARCSLLSHTIHIVTECRSNADEFGRYNWSTTTRLARRRSNERIRVVIYEQACQVDWQ